MISEKTLAIQLSCTTGNPSVRWAPLWRNVFRRKGEMMRVFKVTVVLLLAIACAQAPRAQAPESQPVGNLAQVMRGIFFPNSNIIFDVQSRDPDAPPEENDDGTVTATFSSIYTGWPVVENAAIAIAGATQLIRMPGRMCQNGREVPLGDDEFMQFAREMEEVAIAAAAVAATKDRDAMIEATNNLAGGCENCHSNYRRYPEENRCQLP